MSRCGSYARAWIGRQERFKVRSSYEGLLVELICILPPLPNVRIRLSIFSDAIIV